MKQKTVLPTPNTMNKLLLAIMAMLLLGNTYAQKSTYFSPTAMELGNDKIFIAGKTGHEIRAYDLTDFSEFKSLKTDLPPKAIRLAGDKIYATCSHSKSQFLVVNSADLTVSKTIKVGHGACDVRINKAQTKAYVANQFSDDISVIDLTSMTEVKRIPVLREPTQIVLSKDERFLYAANFLTSRRADVDTVTAEVSIIDLENEKAIKHLPLANGSNALRGMALSTDGKYIFISHNLGRFQVPTTQLEQGWMNTSALSVISTESQEYIATVLLDEPENGAAGSWGIECSEEYILVAHSGTHDFSVINYADFITKLLATNDKESLSYDLRFLADMRKRIKTTGNGPRIIKLKDNTVFAANYFSDFVDIIDLDNPAPAHYKQLVLNDNLQNNQIRLGEIYFNDATYCFQAWQSCNGCHPGDARTDGLNWDLLNDGMGNPKNCKSMLGSHETAPAMISGIRPDAETAVRAGFRHIQFVQIEDEHALAVDAYLKSLEAVPSPYLVDGKLSAKAEKGKEVFEQVGCKNCHHGPWFTEQKLHEIGTQGEFDHQNKWDTPTLVETWRTAPYLHDGRAATMKDVFTQEKHGLRKNLSEEQIDQLVEYVLSL